MCVLFCCEHALVCLVRGRVVRNYCIAAQAWEKQGLLGHVVHQVECQAAAGAARPTDAPRRSGEQRTEFVLS